MKQEHSGPDPLRRGGSIEETVLSSKGTQKPLKILGSAGRGGW